ncbi:MAG: 6-pyruvoyl-tetrahydropterin synthase-related protein [Acidobacteriota bacterium]
MISGLAAGAVGAAVWLAALPILKPGLPLGADSLTHLYTLVHVDQLVQSGVYFSRWLPFQNGGLGNPRFLYYPALPFYLAELWVVLGASYVTAMRLATGAALVAAAAGAFAWCRVYLRNAYLGHVAAAVGAIAYVLSPYLLFAAYSRASFAELTALGLAPWALWAAARHARHDSARTGRWLAASATLLALTVLSHPITGAVVAGVCLGMVWIPTWLTTWLKTRLASGDGACRARPVGGTLAVLLALGASSMLWLPAALERGAIGDAQVQAAGLDYRGNFLPIQTLLSLPGERLGAGYAAAALVLALIAVVGVFARRWRAPRPSELSAPGWIFPCFLGWTALTALALPQARPLWDLFAPMVRDVQFPHRLLGPGSLLLAGLAAAGAQTLCRALTAAASRRKLASAAAALVMPTSLIALATSALPLGDTARLPKLPTLDVDFVVAKERQVGLVGRGYQGDFLPRGVHGLRPAWRLVPSPHERFVEASLPTGAKLLERSHGSLHYEIEISNLGSKPWTAVWGTLAFPGWRAEAETRTGTEPLITGVTEHGLLTTEVPPDALRVSVRFQSTPARQLGGWVTSISFLMIFLAALWPFDRIGPLISEHP